MEDNRQLKTENTGTGTGKTRFIERPHVKTGLTVLIIGAALIIFYYIVNNFSTVSVAVKKVNDTLMPFYLGIMLAYLLCPLYNGLVKRIYKLTREKFRKASKSFKFSKIISTVICIIILLAIIAGFLYLVLPELFTSIYEIARALPGEINRATNWLQKNLDNNPELEELLETTISEGGKNFVTWLREAIIPGAGAIITTVSKGAISMFRGLFDFFIGVIVCVYLLNSKEMFIAQLKKVVLAAFKPETARRIFKLGMTTHDTFGGFVNGKILDSVLIGIICYILMLLIRIPLPELISLTIGVTNIIPFFGPFLGAIPSILLLLIVDPIQALKFGILILLLQQFDGNILGPKILGKTTKLAGFWVMFAIIVGGGLFGFVGMILSVPVFAVLYTYLSKLLNRKIKNKNYPEETALYQNLDKYDADKSDIFGAEVIAKGERNENFAQMKASLMQNDDNQGMTQRAKAYLQKKSTDIKDNIAHKKDAPAGVTSEGDAGSADNEESSKENADNK